MVRWIGGRMGAGSGSAGPRIPARAGMAGLKFLPQAFCGRGLPETEGRMIAAKHPEAGTPSPDFRFPHP